MGAESREPLDGERRTELLDQPQASSVLRPWIGRAPLGVCVASSAVDHVKHRVTTPLERDVDLTGCVLGDVCGQLAKDQLGGFEIDPGLRRGFQPGEKVFPRKACGSEVGRIERPPRRVDEVEKQDGDVVGRGFA